MIARLERDTAGGLLLDRVKVEAGQRLRVLASTPAGRIAWIETAAYSNSETGKTELEGILDQPEGLFAEIERAAFI